MEFIQENINTIGGVALLVLALIIITRIANLITKPSVRILYIDASKRHLQILISHHRSQFPMHLGIGPDHFEFEGFSYYWAPVKRESHEVYTLCIDKGGKMVELLRIDFTAKDIKIPQYG